jgi:1,4-dihydroxy-6-naphthoate synthase
LNERAQRGELHISAISIHAYAYVADKYALLPCGASMGDGYGPLVIRKRQKAPVNNELVRETLRGCTIAVPGTMTSAFLALQLFLGEFNSIVAPFDKIFEVVENGSADAGLIIHEGQLTYARSGFEKIVDLGEWWKHKTGLPLPLGGNVVRKDIPLPVRHDISQIIRESIDYGLTHRDEAVGYSLAYARDMNSQLASKFIGMYVNEFTRDYGEIGRAAIRKFLSDAHENGYIAAPVELEFVE